MLAWPPTQGNTFNVRLFFVFVLGASLSANVMFFFRPAPPSSGRIGADLIVESPEKDFRPTIDMRSNEMKKLITAAVMLGFAASASAQTVPDDISRVVESVVIDNLKTVAGSGAQGLAVSSQAQASAQSILFQNAVSHSARINAITERALAQTMIVGATEGAQGIKTVNEAGTTRDIGQMLGLLNAIVAGQKQNAQVVALPTTP